MRRSEKEIVDRAEIDAIIRRSRVCRLGLSDCGQPYVVPLCFGYNGTAVYFHCAPDGRKLDILSNNDKVCVEFDVLEGVVEDDQACRWGARYQSVIGFGTAHIVSERAEKKDALALLMSQYSDRAFLFAENMMERTVVVRVDIDSITGKQSKRLTE